MYLNYHIYTGGSDKRKRRDDLMSSGISLNDGPVIFSNSQIFAEDPRNRKRRDVFDDITISGDPSIKFSCKYDR